MYDCVIIGGGVIGLAIGRHFALAGKTTAILEANATIGSETSFRNSAVIHAGIYYPNKSLKAKLCVSGNILLKEYCRLKSIPYKDVGKLIIAADQRQIKKLAELRQQGIANGIANLIWVDKQQLQSMEPHVRGVAGLYSPNTSIINGQLLMQTLKEDFLKAGGKLFNQARVNHCEYVKENFFVINTDNCQEPFSSKMLINSAGLWAQEVAKKIQGLPLSTIPPLYLAKGNYFTYLLPSPFRHLIYPLPESAGLGIHATMDLDNNVRFGPDVEWVDDLNFITSLSRKELFIEKIKHYYPELDETALVPDHQHTGVRPKILPRNQQPQDFLIQTESQHGIKGLINLYGMESPGLTAALAIAEYIVFQIIY